MKPSKAELLADLKTVINPPATMDWKSDCILQEAQERLLAHLAALPDAPSPTKPEGLEWVGTDGNNLSYDGKVIAGIDYSKHNGGFYVMTWLDEQFRKSLTCEKYGPLEDARTALMSAARTWLSPVSDASAGLMPPREPSNTMMEAGLYHSSHDATWSDVYTMWTNMWDTAFRDDDTVPAPVSYPTDTKVTIDQLNQHFLHQMNAQIMHNMVLTSALRDLNNACMEADKIGELCETITGDMMAAATMALEGKTADGKFIIPDASNTVRVKREDLALIMSEEWNEICNDTGCHPLDITHGNGTDLFFNPSHWVDQICDRLRASLSGGDANLSAAIGERG